MCNTAVDKPDGSAHIIISTLGSILNQFSGRSKGLDLSELRVFVLDEADAFFLEETRKVEIMKFHKILQGLSLPIQYVFFSATYDSSVSKEIAKILDEAIQISLQIETLKLDNI